MKVLTAGNFKGGTGKTFVSKTLAEFAALIQKKRTLLIDLDPQTNLSRRFLEMDVDSEGGYIPPIHPDFELHKADEPDWDGRDSSASIWLNGISEPYPTNYELLKIIPSHSSLLQKIELLDAAEVYAKVSNYFRDFVWLDHFQENFDLVIIDTRPSKGPLVQAALHASTHVVIPSQMESPSVEGLQGMISLIAQINAGLTENDRRKLVGILPNMFRTNLGIHEEFLDMLKNDDVIGPRMLDVMFHDWTGYKHSMIYGEPSLFLRKIDDKHYREAMSVCETILDRVFD